MPYSRSSSLAATAQLEGWRLPVAAALQPVLVVDDELRLVAASPAAVRLLLLPGLGRPLIEAAGLADLAEAWDATPFVLAVETGEPQRGPLELPCLDVALDAVVSPLFGPHGVIGAMVFLTSV